MKKLLFPLIALGGFVSAQVGIETLTPNDKLEINSKTAGDSGLTFTTMNSSTAPQDGAAIGVNKDGKVIVINPGETVIKFLESDLSTQSTDYQDAITISGVPAGQWVVKAFIRYKANRTSGDIKFQFATDSSMAGTGFMLGANPGNGSLINSLKTQEKDYHEYSIFTHDFEANGDNDPDWGLAKLDGILTVTTTGKLTLKYAKSGGNNGSGNTTYLGSGTYIRLSRYN